MHKVLVISGTLAIVGLIIWNHVGHAPEPLKRAVAKVEQPKEKVYAWDNNSPSGRTVKVWHDPKTMCAYLLGAHIGMTIRYTRSGKPDCPGVI